VSCGLVDELITADSINLKDQLLMMKEINPLLPWKKTFCCRILACERQ
jgi:hypothetical protein